MGSTSDEPAGGPTFEQALAELERIVHDLEEGRLGLAPSLARYEEGVKLLRQCYQLLEGAERKIEVLAQVTPAGEAVTEPWDETAPEGTAAEPRSRRRSRTGRAPPDSAADPGMDEAPGLF
jgi:exodeoxyribonuclease VII small subunit